MSTKKIKKWLKKSTNLSKKDFSIDSILKKYTQLIFGFTTFYILFCYTFTKNYFKKYKFNFLEEESYAEIFQFTLKKIDRLLIIPLSMDSLFFILLLMFFFIEYYPIFNKRYQSKKERKKLKTKKQKFTNWNIVMILMGSLPLLTVLVLVFNFLNRDRTFNNFVILISLLMFFLAPTFKSKLLPTLKILMFILLAVPLGRKIGVYISQEDYKNPKRFYLKRDNEIILKELENKIDTLNFGHKSILGNTSNYYYLLDQKKNQIIPIYKSENLIIKYKVK